MKFSYAPAEIKKTVYGYKIRVMNAAMRNQFLAAYGSFRTEEVFRLPGCQAPGLKWPPAIIWVPFHRQGTNPYETLQTYISKPGYAKYGVLVQPFGIAPDDGVCVAFTEYVEDAAAVLAISASARLVREPTTWRLRPKPDKSRPYGPAMAMRGLGQEGGVITLPTLPAIPGIPGTTPAVPAQLPDLPGYVTQQKCDTQLEVCTQAGADVARNFALIGSGVGLVVGFLVGRIMR